MPHSYDPQPEHKFSFGLWTVGNRGRDPFGDVVRPALPPVDAVKMLGDIGAWGVNLHDNDLVPIDATSSERDQIVKAFQRACTDHGVVVPMATVNLFYDAVFRDGAFTANDPRGPRLRRAEDPARHGSRRRARREDLRAVGRPGRNGNRRLPPAGRSGQAAARSRQLSLRVLDRPQVRLPLRARVQAERAARRHLHGVDWRVPRLHSHARPSGAGGRESGSRARAHGRPELPPRDRRRPGKPASCSISI